MNPNRIFPLADGHVRAVESPDPASIYTYTPGIALLPDGAYLLTMDYGGPGARNLAPAREFAKPYFGSAFLSRDKGQTWRHVLDFPAMHARPFCAGGSVYILGHYGDLVILRSDDNGETWGPPRTLTAGERWHQSACNVWYENGFVYLVMEYIHPNDMDTWPVEIMAPVLLRASASEDLCLRENWTFSEKTAFRDLCGASDLQWHGIPFFPENPHDSYFPAPERNNAPIGWLETNVVRITDPSHYWYDPSGRTFHLFARAHTGGTGYCALLKAVEREDGTIQTLPETVPSGKKILYLPMPGGHLRFHMLYDGETRLYWLLSTQATDSMTRAELLPPTRFNLPNNERNRLQLHFSKNCVDWCFAGMVSIGDGDLCSRHYASMLVDGEDLVVASRSGDQNAKSAHNGNFISIHRVRDFRGLVY